MAPPYLNGSTATQNPSSARAAPESGRRHCSRRSCFVRNLQPGLAQPVEQVLGEFRVEPLAEVLPRHRAEVRHQRLEFAQRRARALLFAELPIDGSQVHVRVVVAGHVDLQGGRQCAGIVAPAVGVAKGEIVIPARMMGVELNRAIHDAQAVFPVAGVGNHLSE